MSLVCKKVNQTHFTLFVKAVEAMVNLFSELPKLHKTQHSLSVKGGSMQG